MKGGSLSKNVLNFIQSIERDRGSHEALSMFLANTQVYIMSQRTLYNPSNVLHIRETNVNKSTKILYDSKVINVLQ